MNHHGDKLTYALSGDPGYDPSLDGAVEEAHACPNCGNTASRLIAVPAE
jgi:hypothetical protein